MLVMEEWMVLGERSAIPILFPLHKKWMAFPTQKLRSGGWFHSFFGWLPKSGTRLLIFHFRLARPRENSGRELRRAGDLQQIFHQRDAHN